MKVKLELDLTFNQLLQLLEILRERDISVLNEVDLGALDISNNRPQSEISKLKLFMEIFRALSGINGEDVEEESLKHELLETGRFSKDDIVNFITKTIQNGQIYERRSGVYAKT